MQPKELDQILSQVARKNHISVQQVRAEILIAMEDAQRSTDPKAKALWESIPRRGVSPTLEEFMDFMIHRLKDS